MASLFTHAYLQGPNGGTLHGPNGAAFEGPNAPALNELSTPLLTAVVGREDPYTEADKLFCSENLDRVKFSRTFKELERAEFLGEGVFAQQYVCFTTMTDSEYDAWVVSEGLSTVQGWLMDHPDGDYYEGIDTGSEWLCDFTNTDWLDFRLSTIPGWTLENKLADTNLSLLFIDLAPLFPVDNLTRTGEDPGKNPFGDDDADYDTWKTGMLNMLKYVRDRIDLSIKLPTNTLRHFVGETQTIGDEVFTDDPAVFEPYDGTAAYAPGVASDILGIEIDIDYEEPETNKLIYAVRAVARAQDAGIRTGSSFKFDHGNLSDSSEEAKRWTNLAVYALTHGDRTLFNAVPNESFSPYPLVVLPENVIELGTPDIGMGVPDWFLNYDPIVPGLITRTFSSGRVALFNFSTADILVPSTYLQNWRMVDATLETTVISGATDSALTTDPNLPDYVPAGMGMILTPTADYKRIHLKLDGDPDTAFANQADGYGNEHFILTPGPPQILVENGENAVLFNGESSYAHVPYTPSFDKFFMRDSAPGQTAWSQYVWVEIDRESFVNLAFDDAGLMSFKGLCDIYLKLDSAKWYFTARIFSGVGDSSREVTSPVNIRVGKRYLVGITRGTASLTLTVKEEGESLVATKQLYGGFPPTFDYARLPEVYVGCAYNTVTDALEQFFPGRIYGFGMFDIGGLGVAEISGDLSTARNEPSVFLFLAEDAAKDRMVDAGPFSLSCFFDFYSTEMGRLYYTRGTRPSGSYLAALEGLALAESGPVSVVRDVPAPFETSLRRTLDAQVSSIKRGNKVFAVSNEASYVFDDLTRKGRPIGIPKVIGNPSLTVISEGVLNDVHAYGYRWVTADGTKGPFATLGAIDSGEDAKVVIGESGLVLGLDYVLMDLDVTDPETSKHIGAKLENDYAGTGLKDSETFTVENYVRIPDAANLVRESIWDAGMRFTPARDDDNPSWGGATNDCERFGLAHYNKISDTEVESFTHIVAFEINWNPEDLYDAHGLGTGSGALEFCCLTSRAQQRWDPMGGAYESRMFPDMITYKYDPTNDGTDSRFWFRKNDRGQKIEGPWNDGTDGFCSSSAVTAYELNGPPEPLVAGDRVIIAHAWDATTDTHQVYIKVANVARYPVSKGVWYSTTIAERDGEDYVPGGYFLAGLAARDAAIWRERGAGANTYNNGIDVTITEMLARLPGVDNDTMHMTWYANRLFSNNMSKGTVEDVAEFAFIRESDGAVPSLVMDMFCRPDDHFNDIGSKLYDHDTVSTDFNVGAHSVLPYVETGPEFWNDYCYCPELEWNPHITTGGYWKYQINPWRAWINEHYVCPLVIPAKTALTAATADPALAIAYTPFGDGSYQVYLDGVCVYRETMKLLESPKLDHGAVVEGLSVGAYNFHWVTVEFSTDASEANTVFTLEKVFLGTKPVITSEHVGDMEANYNPTLMYVGATEVEDPRLLDTGDDNWNFGTQFPNEGGLCSIHLADFRAWAGSKYKEQQDFNLSETHVPSDFYKDMWWYFDVRPENKVQDGLEFYIANFGTFSTNHDDDDHLVFTDSVHSLIGDTEGTTIGLPTAPEPHITGLELARTTIFGFQEDLPSGGEVAQRMAEALRGPYYLLDFIPRGQRIYIDNVPDVNLGIPIDPTSGDYPRVSKGVARWGDHIVLYGDPATPATLYVSEPGPTGWESYPYGLTFDTKLKEVTALVTLGLDAVAFGASSAIALGGDPTNPQEIDLGAGVGAQSPRAAGAFDGRVYAFNGRLWMVDPGGQVADLGRDIQDILPTTGRIRFSAIHASLFLIDEDDGRVIRFYIPTGEFSVEDRNARDCFESGGQLYWISRSGQLSLDQEGESSPLYGDDVPYGLSSTAITVSEVADTILTVSETLPTNVPSAYESNVYWDLKGVPAVVYPAAGTAPIAVTIAKNTATRLDLESNPGGITDGDTLWLGANIYGLVLDTGWFFSGERFSVLRGVLHSIQTGGNFRIQGASRDFLGNPVETVSWGYGDGAAVSSDGVHALGTSGNFHRVRISSAPPAQAEASWTAYEIQSLKQ